MKRSLIALCTAVLATSASAQNLVGGDISLLSAYEAAGTKHLDASGKAIPDVIEYLKVNAGMNAMRVRLFVAPSGKSGDGKNDPAVCQDLNYVQKLGKRIKDAGLKLMLDFHYSDTWADPNYQTIPASWTKNTSNEALTDSMYCYTKRCLEYLNENGATPDYVQIGNEISYGMLWRNANDKCYTTTSQTATSAQWTRLCNFLNAGAKAVREVTPDAKIVIHTERSGKAEQTQTFYQFLNANKVDYDVIGLSYYPFWHGYLASLSSTLTKLEQTQPNKEVQIVETAYYHQWFPSDATVNTTSTWQATVSGQAKFITDLSAELNKHSNVKGMFYWCPEEAGNGKNKTVMNSWMNRGFWWEDSQWPINEAFAAFKEYSTTGIHEVTADQSASADNNIYTLSGQRVQSITSPGVYIKGGKKISHK